MTATSAVPGAVVAGRRLVERLGQGGEGEVWRAERPDGSPCAVKLIRPQVLASPEEVRRRGAWLVRIDHPALVRVTRGGRFTGGELAGWGFVEMDLVDGRTLQDVGPLPDALELLAPVAEALDLLHAGTWSDGVPLIHRDIKPGNLLDDGEGLVLVDPSTMRGLDTTDLTRVGTPAYLAPEVHTGRFGPPADVYSLAATAVALLTGRRGRLLVELLDDPGSLALPPQLAAGLDPDPGRRPPSCAAVLRAASVVPMRSWSTGPDRTAGPSWALPLLAAVLGAPAVAYAIGWPSAAGGQPGTVVAAVAVVAHLAVHAVARQAALGLLAPPWAWGQLVAGTAGGARWAADARGRPDGAGLEEGRRRWLADVVAGVLVALAGGVAVAVNAGADRAVVPLAVVVALLACLLARRAAGVRGRMRRAVGWVLAAPLWLLGALPRAVVTGGRR